MSMPEVIQWNVVKTTQFLFRVHRKRLLVWITGSNTEIERKEEICCDKSSFDPDFSFNVGIC